MNSPSSTWPRARPGWAVLGGVGALIVIGVLARSLWPQRVSEPPDVHTTPWLEGGQIHYPQSFAEREQLTFVPASEAVLTPALQVTGVIATDARRVAAIGGRISGRLRQVSKIEGDVVEAGEVMAELESLALGQAQTEVLKSRARETVAKLDAERERRLADGHITSERDAQLAAANAEALSAERVAAERGVEAMGGTMGGEFGVLKLRSPLRGHVIEASARRGQTVDANDTLFTVADLSQVWAELLVFEKDLAAVRVGDEVELQVPALRNGTVKAKVAHVAETIDPRQRGAEIRVEVENSSGALRPGLSVTAVIHASGPREERLVVPKAAVTRVDGKPTVFVATQAGAVEPRAIEVGPEDGQVVSIVSGLQRGEQVATRGVLALKAEVFR